MPATSDTFLLKFDRPATYRIIVHGLIDDYYSDYFAGMRKTTKQDENKGPITILTGQVQDQAELAGVLNNLYEKHVSIISVENYSERTGSECEVEDLT